MSRGQSSTRSLKPSAADSPTAAAAAAAGSRPTVEDAAAAAAAAGKRTSADAGGSTSSGTHVYVADTRNENILVGIRDGVTDNFDLIWRPQVRWWYFRNWISMTGFGRCW